MNLSYDPNTLFTAYVKLLESAGNFPPPYYIGALFVLNKKIQILPKNRMVMMSTQIELDSLLELNYFKRIILFYGLNQIFLSFV